MENRNLNKDLEEIKFFFPKLKFYQQKKRRFLKGDLDICDQEGNYLKTFEIAIDIPENYPYGVPLLFELSENIPRIEDRHINNNGLCCVDIDHELLLLARRGLRLFDFIRDKVYPYFANQLFYEFNDSKYANGEYEHRFQGVIQFYSNRLGLEDPKLIVSFLECLISNKLPGRNKPCLCNAGLIGKKYKHCHEDAISLLKSIEKGKIMSDLIGFKKEFNI